MNKIINIKLEKIMSRIIFLMSVILISTLTTVNIFAQDTKREREVIVTAEINQLLQSQYNGLYEVADIIDIDSLTGDLRYFYYTVQNPYGMLTNKFVFITNTSSDYQYTDPVNNKLGLYKDNTISWLSENDLPDDFGKIFAIDDITNDGGVEILTKWGFPLSTVWIHSWNGSITKRINAVDDGYSKIEGYEKSFGLFDAEGDGILEIRNVEDENIINTWSWNGTEYGKWATTPNGSIMELYPANNFIPHIKVNIIKSDERFIYEYEVTNDPQSKQRIDMFWIVADVLGGTLEKEFPKYWTDSGYSRKLDGWESEILNNGNLIWPGASLGGFVFKTTGLPAIVEFNMQAANKLPTLRQMSSSEAGDIIDKDLEENIVKGRTIGPKEPHDTLDNLIFLDSLIRYDSTAYEFGWINNQKTFEKIDKYLGKAKAELEKSKIDKTKSALEKVLREVEKESSSSLSSEAYALLKYNTEYLIEHLPPFGMTLDSLSPTMTITKTKTKDFTLTVYGSNFSKKSDVYWNGKKKKTKFISEIVLEAKIKKKDIKKEGTYSVHVSEKKVGRTEELEFNIYKELPEKIIPVLNCIEDLDGKKSLVWFGYENYNDGIVLLDGKENEIKGGKKKKGEPPVIFLPGVHEKVFSVEYDDKKKLKWELLKEKAEVKEDTPVCQ